MKSLIISIKIILSKRKQSSWVFFLTCICLLPIDIVKWIYAALPASSINKRTQEQKPESFCEVSSAENETEGNKSQSMIIIPQVKFLRFLNINQTS